MASTDALVFFSAQTADANSASMRCIFPSGRGQFSAWGTFGGGTVTLQFSPDGGTAWVNVKDKDGNDIAYTSARAINIETPHGELLRCVLSGSTSASINAKLQALNGVFR